MITYFEGILGAGFQESINKCVHVWAWVILLHILHLNNPRETKLNDFSTPESQHVEKA